MFLEKKGISSEQKTWKNIFFSEIDVNNCFNITLNFLNLQGKKNMKKLLLWLFETSVFKWVRFGVSVVAIIVKRQTKMNMKK